MGGGHIASEDLRLGIERIERLEEEKKGIADDIKDVYAEYKSKGFDTKTMREIVRLRKMRPDERREREAMLDTYKAALGMLDGTPLGHWALERLKPKDEAPPPPGAEPDREGKQGAEPAEPASPPEPELTVEDARRLGHEAAAAGVAVTANPFPARDQRRAAWDEAWCMALGSDGMDIPDALKPASKKKSGSADEAAPGDDE